MPPKRITRREMLKLAAATGAAGLTGSLLTSCGGRPAFPTPPGTSTCAKITDIDHVVILIQENRSFDHYFGSYRGVRGFSDASAAFNQPYPGNTSSSPAGVLLPFHLDTTQTNAACTHDITHDWIPQHQSWDNGAMDGFVTSRLAINANDAVLSMGYYTRADLPYYYAVADAFTLCDNYCCSVIGPTDPNRLYTMAASIDPDGKNGGPLLQTLVSNRAAMFGKLTYTTMPEQLQARGISWKIYSTARRQRIRRSRNRQRTSLFQEFSGPRPRRFTRTHSARSSPPTSLPTRSQEICRRSPGSSDRSSPPTIRRRPRSSARTRYLPSSPPSPPTRSHGPRPFSSSPTTKMAASSITSRRSPPPRERRANTSPRAAVPDPTVEGSINGPIGLGFRVPMLIISPFSRGGFISSDLFDHTSVLRFLETRFGAEVPNLSAWRRATVGDMTSAFNFTKPDTSIPSLPSTVAAIPTIITECANNLAGFAGYTLPAPQVMPTQEAGSPIRPSGTC